MKRTNITLTYNELMHIEKCLEDNLNWNEQMESKLLGKVKEERRKMGISKCKECFHYDYCKKHVEFVERSGYCEDYRKAEILIKPHGEQKRRVNKMCKIIKGDNKKILPALIEDIKKLADKKGILCKN